MKSCLGIANAYLKSNSMILQIEGQLESVELKTNPPGSLYQLDGGGGIAMGLVAIKLLALIT